MTLAEIQEILYSPEKERNVVKVLRLHNITFKHAMLLKIHFANKLKKLTERKFFGVYYHSLIIHARQQYRIISGRTANTEKEEAMFTTIKNNTNLTSNHHPDNIISNVIIRYQAKEKLEVNKINKEVSVLTELYQPIKKLQKNSVIPFTWIENYYNEYQAHLESISDYLLDKKPWWQETDIGVMYFDVENELGGEMRQSCINLHHFRSSTLKKEVANTNECWLKCINKKEVIPAKMIKVCYSTDEKVIINLSNLIYYKHPQICNNDERLFENPSEPPSSEIMLDNQELISIEINQSLTSAENISGIFPTPSDKYQNPNFTNITSHSSEFEQLNKTNIVPYSDSSASSATSVTRNISIVPPFSSTPIKCKEKNPSKTDYILNFKLQPPKSDNYATNSSLSCSSKMLVTLNLDEKTIQSYDKLRKQLKNKNYDNYREYTTLIAQLEVKLLSKEAELEQQLNEIEKDIFLKSGSLKTLPESENATYNALILKLKYIKILKKDMNIKTKLH